MTCLDALNKGWSVAEIGRVGGGVLELDIAVGGPGDVVAAGIDAARRQALRIVALEQQNGVCMKAVRRAMMGWMKWE